VYASHSFIAGHYARTYLLRFTRENELSITSQPTGKITAPLAQRICWAVLILITLYVCYFSHLGVIGFVGPDEPRYAWIARDMAETGDWVTPRLYGRPWFEKPPLLYWGGAIFFKLFGPSAPEVAARLPSAISALLATLALAWLAWRTYGEECARWLLLLLPTSVGMIGFSHAAATDMPFAGMLTIAMVCAAVVLGLTQSENTPILPRTPWLALVPFGFFLGLAVLAKGPAAIILCGGAVFFWAIFTKRWRDALRLLHPAAIAAFCVTALPWYMLCARRNPDFFRIFIIEHNFKRYLTPEFQHVQPFWFYVPVVLLGLVPWVAMLGPVLREVGSIRVQTEREQGMLPFAMSWAVFPILFFTLSKSKLPGYVLPIFPPLSFLMARTLRSQASRAALQWALLGSGVVLTVLGACTGLIIRVVDRGNVYSFDRQVNIVIVFVVFAGLAAVSLALVRRVEGAALVVQTTLLLCMFAGIPDSLGGVLDARFSTRLALEQYRRSSLAEAAKSTSAEPSTYNLRRDYQYSLNFYFHRELPSWTEGSPGEAIVFIPTKTVSLVPPFVRCPTWESVFVVRPCLAAGSLDRLGDGRKPKQKE
jgi:4-amino-4-deoxy-L-arabinose transferase-like glycosyltransferase